MNIDLHHDVTGNYDLCMTNFLYLCFNKKINVITYGENIFSGILEDYSEYFIKLKNNNKYTYILRKTVVGIEIEDDIMGCGN